MRLRGLTRARLLVGSALSGLLLLVAVASVAAPSAQAADICVAHPSDPSVVCVRNNDTTVDACDRDNDTHRVYARLITEASSPSFQSPFYDDNGSNPGCGNFNFPSRVLSVAVCVQTEGCSAFKQTGPAAAPIVPPPAAAPIVPPPVAAPSGPAAPGESVIYAAGDISCNRPQRQAAQRTAQQGKKVKTCQSRATYNKIRELETQRGNPGLPSAVLALGDIQYEVGSFGAFLENYQPDWGPLKPTTFPAVGNHEYETKDAADYWRYFNTYPPINQTPTNGFGKSTQGWYAFNSGSWRIYAINSNCTDGKKMAPTSCARGSAQYNWLLRDMRANPRRCSLMFMHHPYWDSSQDNFNTPKLGPLIRLFSDRGGDVVLAGHAHDYERFARSNPAQQEASPNARGFRLFIVGTGGKNLRPFARPTKKKPNPIEPNSRRRNNTDFGVLQLRLGKARYGWRFASAYKTEGGVFSDAGTGQCR